MSQVFKITNRLTATQKKFFAELVGTFIVVVLATGSVVLDAKLGKILGILFIAFAPFVGVAISVYLFGNISMAHFNPAVSIGFLITKHLRKQLLAYYLGAEVIGALLGSLFVKALYARRRHRRCSSLRTHSPAPDRATVLPADSYFSFCLSDFSPRYIRL